MIKKASYEWILPRLIAHRGASTVAPENTIVALQKAEALGAKWVEFDVTLDSRGEAIVFHDKKLHRTTDGHGYVARTPYAVIATLDAGHWFHKAFVGERVPTLTDYLTEAAKLNIGINLEMKLTKLQNADLLADQVIANLSRYWKSGLPAPLISSFSTRCLKAIYRRAPHLMYGYNMDRWKKSWKKVMARYQCVSLHVNEKYLTPDRVAEVKSAGYRLLAFTVNDVHRANVLFDMGVDAIFSNDVTLLK